MKKIVTVLCLILLFTFTLCSCNSPKKPESQKTQEIEKKIIGKWKFLYTDAAEEIPPKDITYTFLEDYTSILEYTSEKNEKKRIEVTYQINEDIMQTFQDGMPSKEFHIQFESENTIRLTEKNSKNAIVLERIR